MSDYTFVLHRYKFLLQLLNGVGSLYWSVTRAYLNRYLPTTPKYDLLWWQLLAKDMFSYLQNLIYLVSNLCTWKLGSYVRNKNLRKN